jgi:hypothetical protein
MSMEGLILRPLVYRLGNESAAGFLTGKAALSIKWIGLKLDQ